MVPLWKSPPRYRISTTTPSSVLSSSNSSWVGSWHLGEGRDFACSCPVPPALRSVTLLKHLLPINCHYSRHREKSHRILSFHVYHWYCRKRPGSNECVLWAYQTFLQNEGNLSGCLPLNGYQFWNMHGIQFNMWIKFSYNLRSLHLHSTVSLEKLHMGNFVWQSLEGALYTRANNTC